MAINLPNLVSQLITPDLINRIATALGINPALAQTVVTAAIPAVLGAFASEASSPEGAKAISDEISNQDPEMLENLASAIKGGDPTGALANGNQVLTNLLGNEGFNQLSNVLGEVTGAPQHASSALLGLVGPAVTGAIANQPPETWSDGASIANLFAGEKQAIAASLPAGLAAKLSDNGFLEGFGNLLGGATATVAGAAAGAASAARSQTSAASEAIRNAANSAPPPPAYPVSSGTGTNTWIYLIVAIIIVGGLAWYFMHKPASAPPAGDASGQISQPSGPVPG